MGCISRQADGHGGKSLCERLPKKHNGDMYSTLYLAVIERRTGRGLLDMGTRSSPSIGDFLQSGRLRGRVHNPLSRVGHVLEQIYNDPPAVERALKIAAAESAITP